ncbi:MAG: hypothetical protein M1822_004597 [Bathelium mastoideum]|nr:MAG: hypothetical protein M1822_004597 [Bathelium mastoideum]
MSVRTAIGVTDAESRTSNSFLAAAYEYRDAVGGELCKAIAKPACIGGEIGLFVIGIGKGDNYWDIGCGKYVLQPEKVGFVGVFHGETIWDRWWFTANVVSS